MGLKSKKSYIGNGKGFHGHSYEHSENMKEVWDKRIKAQYSKNLKQKEHLKGGYGDKIPSSQFDAIQVKKGIKVEMEHTNNPKIAEEIARDHLAEIPDYYDHLEKMEKTATTHKKNTYANPHNPNSVHTKKFDRCVKEVEEKQKGKPKSKQVNPHAVCMKSVGYKKSVTKKHRRKDSDGDGVPDSKDCAPYNPKKQDFGLTDKQQKIVETEFDRKIVNNYEEGRGNVIVLEDDKEFLIFDNYEDAERSAIELVEEDLRENPEMFSQDWLRHYTSLSDTDRRMIADEFATNYVTDIRDEDDGKRLLDEADMLDELEDLDEQLYEEKIDDDKYESEKEKLLDKAEENLIEELYDDHYERLEDPYYYFVEEEGIYSGEDFFKQFPNAIDFDEASEDAVNTDGVAHFLAGYDGRERSFKDGSVGYRIN